MNVVPCIISCLAELLSDDIGKQDLPCRTLEALKNVTCQQLTGLNMKGVKLRRFMRGLDALQERTNNIIIRERYATVFDESQLCAWANADSTFDRNDPRPGVFDLLAVPSKDLMFLKSAQGDQHWEGEVDLTVVVINGGRAGWRMGCGTPYSSRGFPVEKIGTFETIRSSSGEWRVDLGVGGNESDDMIVTDDELALMTEQFLIREEERRAADIEKENRYQEDRAQRHASKRRWKELEAARERAYQAADEAQRAQEADLQNFLNSNGLSDRSTEIGIELKVMRYCCCGLDVLRCALVRTN